MLSILAMLLASAHVTDDGAADRAAVVAAETNWSTWELSGDVASLQSFLTDDYVSVGAGGVAHTKGDLIASALRRAKVNPGKVAEPFPPSSTIQVFGNTAIVRHHSSHEASVDVLQRRGGRWMAWFSEHTAVPSS